MRVSSYAASVAWTTSEPSTGTVQWGPAGSQACPLGRPPTRWEPAHGAAERPRLVDGVQGRDRGLLGRADDRTHGVLVHDAARARAGAGRSPGRRPARERRAVLPLLSWQQCPAQWQASLDAGINLFAAGSPCASPSSTLAALTGRALDRRRRRRTARAGPSRLVLSRRGGRARADGDVAAGAACGSSLSDDHLALRLGSSAPAFRSRHVSRVLSPRPTSSASISIPSRSSAGETCSPLVFDAQRSSKRSHRESRPFSGSRRAACAAATRRGSDHAEDDPHGELARTRRRRARSCVLST